MGAGVRQESGSKKEGRLKSCSQLCLTSSWPWSQTPELCQPCVEGARWERPLTSAAWEFGEGPLGQIEMAGRRSGGERFETGLAGPDLVAVHRGETRALQGIVLA